MSPTDIRKSIEKHFVSEMMMQNLTLSVAADLHFSDYYMTMMFIFSDNFIRILMRSKMHSFSKNLKYDYVYECIDHGMSIPELIRYVVRQNSGKESEAMLDDWYIWKKKEIRDRKISDLGI
jgi:hypothetical protein